MPNSSTSTRTIDTRLCDGPVDIAALDWPAACGAEAIFVGRTRGETHDEFGELEHLEYEVFEPMALKLMDEMCRAAAERWDCHAVRLAHSRGRVGIGEASVVVQVATPHRADAFSACRYLIDRLKHELPIWKIEVWQRGRTRVAGNQARPADGNAQ